MVAYIDTTQGRIQFAFRGGVVVIVGVLLLAVGVPRVVSAVLVVVGTAIILWAWLHTTRSGFPPGFLIAQGFSISCTSAKHRACSGANDVGEACSCTCHKRSNSALHAPVAGVGRW